MVIVNEKKLILMIKYTHLNIDDNHLLQKYIFSYVNVSQTIRYDHFVLISTIVLKNK